MLLRDCIKKLRNSWKSMITKCSLNLSLFIPSIQPSVCSQCKISEMADQFFLIFCIRLENDKLRKMAELEFWEKSRWVKTETCGNGNCGKIWKSFHILFYDCGPIRMQNLFKLQYLSSELRWEVEFVYVIRYIKATNLFSYFNWLW